MTRSHTIGAVDNLSMCAWKRAHHTSCVHGYSSRPTKPAPPKYQEERKALEDLGGLGGLGLLAKRAQLTGDKNGVQSGKQRHGRW